MQQRFQPVERQTLAKVVMRQLTEYVQAGNLTPGEALPPQHELARQFSVSRTVLREAMQGLAAAGLIEIRPGSGCYVREPDLSVDAEALFEAYTHESALDVIETRVVVEVELVGLAAKRRTEEDLLRMNAALERIKQANARGESAYLLTAEFHRLLAKAAHNGVLYRVAQLLRKPTVAEGVRVERELPDVTVHEYETHLRLFEAVQRGDEQEARQLMREHLEIAHGWEQEIANLRSKVPAVVATTEGRALPAVALGH